MTDLITWLRAQLDDDERAVERIRNARMHGVESDAEEDYLRFTDPDRLDDEIDAKRRILELHVGRHWCTPEPEDTDWRVIEAGEEVVRVYPCLHVRLLALPYADQPGYRDEWRP